MKTLLLIPIILLSTVSLSFGVPNLSGNTFKIIHYKQGKKSADPREWRVYFREDGKAYYQAKIPDKGHRYLRTEKWKIKDNNQLCTTRKKRHGLGDHERVTTCGTFVANGQKSYKRFNKKGKLIAIYTYIGPGKRF